MDKEIIFLKLKEEIEKLTKLSDKLFSERFNTEKHESAWNDELFSDYQKARIRINMLFELLKL